MERAAKLAGVGNDEGRRIAEWVVDIYDPADRKIIAAIAAKVVADAETIQEYSDKVVSLRNALATAEAMEQVASDADAKCAAAEQRLQAVEGERLRLVGIVDKLPKTADGVPIVPGMSLYAKPYTAVTPFVASKGFVEQQGTMVWFDTGHGFNARASECYFTEAAALASQSAKPEAEVGETGEVDRGE